MVYNSVIGYLKLPRCNDLLKVGTLRYLGKRER